MNSSADCKFYEISSQQENLAKQNQNSSNFQTSWLPFQLLLFSQCQVSNNLFKKQKVWQKNYLYYFLKTAKQKIRDLMNQALPNIKNQTKQFKVFNLLYKDLEKGENNFHEHCISSPIVHLKSLHSCQSPSNQDQNHSKTSLNRLTNQLDKITLEGQGQKIENEAFEKDFKIQIQNDFSEEDQDENQTNSPQKVQVKRIGCYTKEERANKIQKYKSKLKQYREDHPIKKLFTGRSVVAGSKPRIKGKFVKKEAFDKFKKSIPSNSELSNQSEIKNAKQNIGNLQFFNNNSEQCLKQALHIPSPQRNQLSQEQRAIVNQQEVQQSKTNILKQFYLKNNSQNFQQIPLFQKSQNPSSLEHNFNFSSMNNFSLNQNQNLNLFNSLQNFIFQSQNNNQPNQYWNSMNSLNQLREINQKKAFAQSALLQQVGLLSQQNARLQLQSLQSPLQQQFNPPIQQQFNPPIQQQFNAPTNINQILKEMIKQEYNK